MDRKLVKRIIIENKLLDSGRLRELEGLAVSSNAPLLDSLLGGGYVREEQILPPLAAALGLPALGADEQADPELRAAAPEAFRDHPAILPLCRVNGDVVVAVSDPLDVELLDRFRQLSGWKLVLRLASAARIAALRQQQGGGRTAAAAADDGQLQVGKGDERDDGRSLEELANDAPIVKLVNLVIMQAISVGASDIHVEPFEHEAVVRYRVDGVLRRVNSYPKKNYPAIISRLKIMADLNIAERRVPQDGRIALKLMDKVYDLRVATVPCLHGEGVVMRILDKGNVKVDLAKLGFAPETLAAFTAQIRRAHGIVLVTGPTGSGKTTTLYAGLAHLNQEDAKIITVEDPVEYQLEGINQIQVNAAVGMTFAAGLRSILRLDPDIIMVGEIRDGETAEIAIRSALTGHMVFSTLHTNDAVSAVSRLMDMKVAPYLVSASVNAVLAQRLVRRICRFCRKQVAPDEIAAALFRSAGVECPETVTVGAGCDECAGAGYSGRLGIYELFELDEPLREAITAGRSVEELKSMARERHMRTMRDDGIAKVLAGETTAREILRVTQE